MTDLTIQTLRASMRVKKYRCRNCSAANPQPDKHGLCDVCHGGTLEEREPTDEEVIAAAAAMNPFLPRPIIRLCHSR